MAKKYKILKTDPRTNTHEFLVDDVADLVKLPKETGSLAFMVNTGDLYVCNNLKEWKNVSDPDAPEIVNPSGTLTITENGIGIDVTEYAAVDVNVASSEGDGFGEPQPGPMVSDTIPAIGDLFYSLSFMYNSGLLKSKPQDVSAINPDLILLTPNNTTSYIYISQGIYFISGFYYTDDPNPVNAIDGYICEIDDSYYITSVTPWEESIDTYTNDNIIQFGFTIPDLGGFDFQTSKSSKALVLHVYNDNK